LHATDNTTVGNCRSAGKPYTPYDRGKSFENKHGRLYIRNAGRWDIDNNQLKVGDIIVEFEGKPVSTVDNMHQYLNQRSIGRKIGLAVLRAGRRHLLEAIPGELH
jgi:S1-C subfamily serine protease